MTSISGTLVVKLYIKLHISDPLQKSLPQWAVKYIDDICHTSVEDATNSKVH